ncbi:MAG TPA: Mur ligase family protein [archaeon]|nr:Mur ligase family protein [archaeon]
MAIDLGQLKNLFFSGLGGSGMSALAQLLNGRGVHITGSDRKYDRGESSSLFAKLAAQGIELVPQDGSGVMESLDAVVVSSAVEPDTPDYRRAVELGIPLVKRPELLAALVNSAALGICFSGTSGKSTATGLCAYVLTELGARPNFISGAAVVNYLGGPTTGNALGSESGIYCVEACESDGSIVNYRPAVGVILNLEREHHEISELVSMFERFASATQGQLILNADCPNIPRLDLTKAGAKTEKVSFSLVNKTADLRAENLRLAPLSADFTVGGVEFRSPLPGKYNVYNVLAALAACEAVDIEREDFARVLPAFRGVARRFQVVGESRGVTVIDDFAHNPAKIAAVLSAFEAWKTLRRRIVVFQPHGYGPTRFYLDQLVETFARELDEKDLLILPEIYYAGGTAARDISSRVVAGRVSARGKKALYFERRSEALPVILEEASAGDVVLVLGARDDSLSDFCRQILSALKEQG